MLIYICRELQCGQDCRTAENVRLHRLCVTNTVATWSEASALCGRDIEMLTRARVHCGFPTVVLDGCLATMLPNSGATADWSA